MLPRVMILSAGLGTRLRPLTDEMPKPLVWLGDRPQIDHITLALAEAGFQRVVVNTHHLAERFDGAWLAGQPLSVALSFEPVILGTGGAVPAAAELLGPGELLLWNSDIVTRLDVPGLLAAHRASGALATLAIGAKGAPMAHTVGLDARGDVVRLRAASRPGECASADYAGIALLSEGFRARLSAPSCLVGDGFIPALNRNEKLATFELSAPFTDIGSVAAVLQANMTWLRERGLTSFVDASASVGAEVELDQVVVAPNAQVLGSGRLRRAVVWPSAIAHAPLEAAIITPRSITRP